MIWYQSESQIKVQDLNLADLKNKSKQTVENVYPNPITRYVTNFVRYKLRVQAVSTIDHTLNCLMTM